MSLEFGLFGLDALGGLDKDHDHHHPITDFQVGKGGSKMLKYQPIYGVADPL